MDVVFASQDQTLVEGMARALRPQWPNVQHVVARQGSAAILLVSQEEPELVVVCNDLPDMPGLQLVRELRRVSQVPILVAVPPTAQMDTVRAFEWGADDFVQLSAGSEVLAAQVLALLRRVGPTGARCPESVITRGHLIINPLTRDVFLQGRHVSLTATEFKLLYVLAKYTHLTISREFIRHLIWREQGLQVRLSTTSSASACVLETILRGPR